jgi:ubiquinone/menaquinone biosynthesis C-methylase UbiE
VIQSFIIDEKAKREAEFHNQWARSIDVDSLLVKESFESPAAFENRYALKEMGDIRQKRILDLGCGAGESAVYFSLNGAEVYACDIAEEFIKVGELLSRKHNVSVKFNIGNAACLPYADGYFDFVYGNGVLHHVKLQSAIDEICRVLKPGGRAVFIEPLCYNPVINIYRRIANEVRTIDERPLHFKDMGQFKASFSYFYHREFWFLSLLIFAHFFIIKRCHPSKVRYWKKVIAEGYAYEKYIMFLQGLDNAVLNFFPFFRPLCWNTVLVAVK